MGKTRLMGMVDDRGIGIEMLQLKGPGRTVCGEVPSLMWWSPNPAHRTRPKKGIRSVQSPAEQYAPTHLIPCGSGSRS